MVRMGKDDVPWFFLTDIYFLLFPLALDINCGKGKLWFVAFVSEARRQVR